MDIYVFPTELKEHNHRGWFLESKEHYEEHVRTPALQFVSAAAPAIAKISQYSGKRISPASPGSPPRPGPRSPLSI